MISKNQFTVFDIKDNKLLKYIKEWGEICYEAIPKSLYYSRLDNLHACVDLVYYYEMIGDKINQQYWENKPGVKEFIKKDKDYWSQA